MADNPYFNPHTRDVRGIRQSLAALFSAARGREKQLRNALLLSSAAAVANGIALALLYPVFAALHGGQPLFPVLWPPLTLFVLALGLRFFGEAYDTRGHAQHAVSALRHTLGEKLRRIPLVELTALRAGDISAVLVQSVNEAAAYAFTLLSTVLATLLMPLAAALTLAFFDIGAGLLLLAAVLAVLPLYAWRRRAFRRGFSLLAEANTRLKGEAVEFVQGLHVLKLSAQTDAGRSRLMQTAADVAAIQRIGTKKGEKPNLIITSVMQATLCAVAVYGVFAAALPQGWLLAATALVIVARSADMLNFCVQMGSLLEIFLIGQEKTAGILAMPELPQRQNAAPPSRYDIVFENVSFTYPGQPHPALSDISLSFAQGGLHALTGTSGSGKSTLARLILRHGDVSAGRITIGGTDIRDFSDAQLMAMVAVVFQEVHLFAASVADNIRMARPDATDAQVMAAAEKAQCHDFVMKLPEGYATRLDDGGIRLSGGERQRIAIARAILKDAPILIMDEPTAALDIHNERAVQRALDALVKDKTVLVIAHRLTTIAHAGQIVVLENGKVAERGTHDALLAAGGRYAQLWRQSAGEDIG